MRYKCILFIVLSLLLSRGLFSWAQGGRDESSFYAKSWAVIIGINDYSDFPSLEYAVNDARAVEARFRTMGFDVISLQNQQATKRNILHVLKEQLPKKVGRRDRLVIFYAGHGAAGILPTGEEVGFIIPSDGRAVVDERRLEIIGGEIVVDDYDTFADKANFISVEEIRDVSDSVAAKHIFYIIDGCYSGFLDPAAYSKLQPSRRIGRDIKGSQQETSRGLDLGVEEEKETRMSTRVPKHQSVPTDYLDIITSRDTVQILTAGSSGEKVYEKSGHGIFTYYLLRALDGVADYNSDCVIMASELGTYLKQIVPEASNSSQSPLFNRISGEGEFIFVPPICKPIAPIALKPPVVDKSWTKTDAYKGPKGHSYKAPSQVVVDDEDNLYVLDSDRQRIFKFDATGTYIPVTFENTSVEAPWVPKSMAIGYGGNLWVYYTRQRKKNTASGGKIMVYDANGTPIVNWSGRTEPVTGCITDDGQRLDFPANALIALDIEDNLILVEQESGVITKCDRNGKLLRQWGKYDKHKLIEDVHRYKTVTEPQGMAVDMFGYIYVSDTKGHGIQKFFDGEWIPSWPNVKGKKPFFFDSPHGITVDNKLYVYVADTNNHRIKKYTSGGEKLMAYWGKKHAKKGKQDGEFNKPRDVAVNQDSTMIYVADTGNKRVQRFLVKR